MIRSDWFKRHIEIIVQALAAVLGLKRQGEIQTAIATLEEAVRKAFGMSGQLALGLPLQEFISLSCRGEEPSAEFLSTLAKLFLEWADLLEKQGRADEAALALSRGQELLQLAESKADKKSPRP
ncbi:MAG: hypothetical protein HY922_03870 [Elusimicrobia bacterium]|nr:hypothetical protein [Elusimicrobiota bacterium]